MNPIFNHLTAKTLDNIDDHLANNQVSTDEELWDLFIEDLDLTAEQADAAVELRAQYWVRTFLKRHSPLFQEIAVWFDPNDKSFKSDAPLTAPY